MRKLFLLIILFFLGIPIVPASNGATPSILTVYCPDIKDLSKDPTAMTWSADQHLFRSYDISFSTSIDKFIGAQWIGAAVGQITCVYKTLPLASFPVLLIYHTLTLEPTEGAWSKNLGGYRNCNSFDRTQCPFVIRLQQKPENVYEEAESLKSTTPEPPTE